MSEPTDEEFAKLIAPAITCYTPPLDILPREQSPHWHLKRAYALLFKAGLSDPVLMEACALIDDAHRLINGKDESRPIRRGDVVQCIRDCRADEGDGMYAVKDVSVTDGLTPSGRLLLYGRRFDPESFARIGRARYYPDGTPVED